MMQLIFLTIPKIADIVVYPTNHEQIMSII
jgi:hypothetical protein